ncbi:hypothetical protein ABDK00_001715 [Niabella insulamsoli]|uniref:hypothetical protein n=1 Tax=Niabella insulamsoli TaxID=3144874 RepID=UPI0031FDB8A8
MKKLIVLSVLIALSTIQSCHVKRKIQRSSTSVDSVHVKKSSTGIQQTKKDSVATSYFENFYKIFSTMEFTADKIVKREHEQPGELKFVLNVDELKVAGDTAKAIDKNTGTEATIYTTLSGELAVNIKPKRGKTEEYELTNVRLKTSQGIDTSKSGGSTSVSSSSSATTRMDKNDSTGYKKQTTTKSVDVEKKFGLLKWIGLAVLAIAILRLIIYLLRNTLPLVGWLNKILSFRRK